MANRAANTATKVEGRAISISLAGTCVAANAADFDARQAHPNPKILYSKTRRAISPATAAATRNAAAKARRQKR